MKRQIPIRGFRVQTLTVMLALVLSAGGCGRHGPPNPSGTFEATEVDISPMLAGKLLRVGPHEGDVVAAGDTLLVIDTDLIQLRRTEAATALTAIAARRQAAQDERDQARRSLELATVTLERLTTMSEGGTATQQQLDEARAQRDIRARKVAAATHNIAALDAEADRQRAALAVLDRQIADGTLVSPLDGTVLLRTGEPGEMSSPGALALRLADLGRLKLRFYLDEPNLGLVKLGQELPVAVDAFPGRRFTGTVTWISDEAEFTPKNAQTHNARALLVYAVKLEVANPDQELAIGMPAEVLLQR